MLNYLGLDNMSSYVNWNNILFDRQNNKVKIVIKFREIILNFLIYYTARYYE